LQTSHNGMIPSAQGCFPSALPIQNNRNKKLYTHGSLKEKGERGI